MTIEEYFQKRLKMQFIEARELAKTYNRKFGKYPPKNVFSEYFLTMFCSPEEGKENYIFREQMARGNGYDNTLAFMQTNKPMFENYEAFLKACFAEE